MTEEFVVVDGPDGQALRKRQVAAIRRALEWFVAHPDGEAGRKLS